MLKRTHYTNEVEADKSVVLSGWVSNLRDIGSVKFLILRDVNGTIQVTAKKGSVDEKVLKTIDSLNGEDVVSVKGKVVKNKSAPGGLEIVPSEIEIIDKIKYQVPIAMTEKIESNLDTRLDWRVLDLRKPENLAIFKIQAKIVEGMEEFLRKNDFLQVSTPCLMGAASESGAEVFPVVYFDRESFLRQDPQLHRELIIASGFDKIFDFGPSWRAEPSHTTRHLCEYRGCAIEMGFIKDETDTMRIEEELVVHTLKKVNKECEEELKLLKKEVAIPKTPFPELRFPEIYGILEELGKKIPHGEDYDRESEVLLGKYVKEKHKTDFFFVNRFPSAIKPFYVMKVDDEPEWARSVDMIYKGIEQSSGGQREHRYEKLAAQIKEKGMNAESMEWFTKFFKFGVPTMGGFNIGIERFTMQLLDLSNIREAVLFPRTPERLLP